MKIALYNPGWHIMGGGEKYFATIADALSTEHEVDLIITRPVSVPLLEERLGVNLSRVGQVTLISDAAAEPATFIDWVRNRLDVRRWRGELRRLTSHYDLAFALESNQPFPLAARRNVLHIQVPYRKWQPKDFQHALSHRQSTEARRALARRLTFGRALRGYDFIIYNSRFTARMVEESWSPGVPYAVLYPPVDVPASSLSWKAKSNLILGVGRFFVGGHEKRQAILIDAFRRFVGRVKDCWELHLVGGADNRSETTHILAELHKRAGDLPVRFHVNAPRAELIQLYRAARMIWHATGVDVDETKYPDRVEHFGIAVAEAMAYGAVPLVVNRGGLPEIVEHGTSGFVWETVEALVERARHLAENENAAAMSAAARQRSHTFSRQRFVGQLQEILRRVWR